LVINDGNRTLALEFDNISSPGITLGNVAVPFDPTANESGSVIAARVLQIINSSAVQSVLQVTGYPVVQSQQPCLLRSA
jgi:hypothetical protein